MKLKWDLRAPQAQGDCTMGIIKAQSSPVLQASSWTLRPDLTSFHSSVEMEESKEAKVVLPGCRNT